MCASNRSKGKKVVKKQTQASCEQWPGEGFFHSLIQYAPNVILFLSQDHRILEFNPEAERLYGCMRADVLGKDYFELFLPVEVREAVAADIEKVLRGEISKGFENVIIASSGQERKLSWNVARVLNGDDKPIGILAIGQDITELKQTENALIQERDKLQALMDGITRAGMGIDIVGIDHRVLFQNETLEQRFGDISGEPCYKHFMTQEEPCDRCPVVEAIQQNTSVEAEQKGLDGRDYQIFSAPLPETDGSVNKAIEIVLDITERKQLEDKLKKSEEKYKSLVEHVREIIFMHDSDYILTYISPQCEKITGYAAQELIGQRWDSFATDNPMNELALDILEEARETGKPSVPHQVEVRKKDGDVIVLEVNDRILRNAEGKITGVVGSARDITKQKLMQEALREQQEKAQKYLDVAGVMFVVLDANGTVTLVNKKGCEVLGYKEDEIIGRNWFDNYLPERLKNDVTQVFNKLMAGEIEPVEYYENPVLTKDGKEKLIAWQNTILKDSLGNITGILSSGSDITKRKRSEEAMKKSSIIIDSTTDAVITTDIAGNITFWNKGAEIIYGYPKEEVIGKSISIIYKDQDLHVLESMIVELMERKDIPGIEVTCIDKNKQDIEILLSLTSIRDEEGNVIELVGITKDITERKKADRRIQEYQRQLKSLASELVLAEERERRRIATGLHDDIAQKLAMAKFGLQSLQASMADTDLSQSLEKQCQLMGQIVEDARSLTFELSNPLLYQVGLEAAVESHLVKHIQDEFGIECKFGSEGPHSSLDDDIKIVVFQAVRELLANVIKHANANKLEVCIINSENELKIVVEDDGVGFDPAQIGPHAVGESGFGLFNIRERLEYLGGNLEIESGRKKGACVIMNIPIRADAVV